MDPFDATGCSRMASLSTQLRKGSAARSPNSRRRAAGPSSPAPHSSASSRRCTAGLLATSYSDQAMLWAVVSKLRRGGCGVGDRVGGVVVCVWG